MKCTIFYSPGIPEKAGIPGTRDGVCPVALRLKDLIFSNRKYDYAYINERLDEAWFSIRK